MYTNQRLTQLTLKPSHTGALLLLSAVIGLSGCQSVQSVTKNAFKKPTETVKSADNSEQGYYQAATNNINKKRYLAAINDLQELRTFYPNGQYAQESLLQLMYIKFLQTNYKEAVTDAELFIKLYPSHPKVDYAYYVRGVANMSNTAYKLFEVDQAKRDTAYYRLAYNNFEALIQKYPTSLYAPDAAQRMTYIYNQLAESEINVAQWYVKRKAYVAAAKRAKRVFQHYPQSTSTPQAVAILADTYTKLGISDLAKEYKDLLRLNYPHLISKNGNVTIPKSAKTKKKSTKQFNALNLLSRNKQATVESAQQVQSAQQIQSAQKEAADRLIRTQQIREARRLSLPQPIN